MPRIKKLWFHKKHGKGYVGYYGKEKRTGERVFLLEKEGKNPFAFGSFQQAKENGWRQE